TGATAGAVLGGGAGLLAGLGALAIPGLGPVVAAGWLIATITGAGAGAAVGAAAGGIIGSLTDAGVSEREANVYAEGVRRGGTLVTVRTDDDHAVEVKKIMDSRQSVDWQTREQEYRAGGWERFDPAAGPYTVSADARSEAIGNSTAAELGARPHAGGTTSRTIDTPRDQQGTEMIAADRVSGTTVYDPSGNKLGSVDDIMLDKRGGRVRYAVLSFGGFLGIGDRHYPLPWEKLHYDTSLGGYVVDIDREALENAPSYSTDEAPQWNDPAWSRRVYEHYGASPYWDDTSRRI
ncbi:MAG: PRC-barrel domain-containing protein, partial [Acetobacteraceae bacterium]